MCPSWNLILLWFLFQVCENREFPVHRVILAARSTVFKAMFDRDMLESQTAQAVIEDIMPETMVTYLLVVLVVLKTEIVNLNSELS